MYVVDAAACSTTRELKIACFGDLHLSEKSPRYQHALDVLDRSIELALHANADAFVFLGDLFEGDPSGSEYMAFLFAIHKLRGKHVLITLGNHEAYDALSFLGLWDPLIVVAWDDFQHVQIGSASILMVPYPRRGKPPFDRLEHGSIEESFRGAVDLLASEIRQAKPKHGQLLVFGHFTIEGMRTRDAEFEMHQSNEVVVPLTALEPADLVVVGHIHKRQIITDKIRGAGSLYRCSFAEAEDPKSFCLITVEDSRVTVEDIEVPARAMRVFNVELKELGAASQIWPELQAAAATGAEIKVCVSMDETESAGYSPTVFDEIKTLAPLVTLERDVRPIERSQRAELTADMSLKDEFLEWATVVAFDFAPGQAGRILQKLDTFS